MAFLFSPKARAFADESLESYLLRVVAENFFASYSQLSFAIREELHELDFEAHGAFPVDLKLLNVYHAKLNSHFRMRALGLLERLLGLPDYELKKLALLKSNRLFSGSFSAVHRGGVDIPLSFIRYSAQNELTSVPVCPYCLSSEPYIRQHWHYKPYQSCAEHQCELLHSCPQCNVSINYLENGSVTHCLCGYEFALATTAKADELTFLLSKSLINADPVSSNPLLNVRSASQRFAALVWYQERYSDGTENVFRDAVLYFNDWPKNFYQELDKVTLGAEQRLIDWFNKTPFYQLYGDIILRSQCLYPYDKEPHFIYLALMDYLELLVQSNPKSTKPNVADMLVSVAETAVMLATTNEQVYRLYQEGVLKHAFRQPLRQRIDPDTAIFHLRQVIEYKSSFGANSIGMYLSAW
jgi:hypothetical protein